MRLLEQIQNLHFPAPLPERLLVVEQKFDAPCVDDPAAATRNALTGGDLLARVEAGQRVVIGVGSRGIANLPAIVGAAVDVLKARGADITITPAMGSHAGATPESQMQMLANLGVTEERMGVLVRATMEVQEVGVVPDGPPVYQDTISAAADHTLLVARIKPHTSFRSHIESGLAKMAVIGLGKQHGAATMHARGVYGLVNYLAPAARIYEEKTNIIGGVAIVENAYDETAEIHALSAAEIGAEREAALLARAKVLMPSLPFPQIEVLVVQQIGKNISGTGMDTNVVSRMKIPRQPEPTDGPDIATIAVLDLTEETHGNAYGMGLANVITARVAQQADWGAIYTNALTSGVLGMWRTGMPMTMADDERAMMAALRGCGEAQESARIVLLRDTLSLGTLWVSPSLRGVVDAHERLAVVDEVPLTFANGVMTSPWQMQA